MGDRVLIDVDLDQSQGHLPYIRTMYSKASVIDIL
jgi:hypothetical protein